MFVAHFVENFEGYKKITLAFGKRKKIISFGERNKYPEGRIISGRWAVQRRQSK
jgi:hypothetical protein